MATKIRYNQIQGAPVNVLDYGAVGDGVTDDTAAIQAAWDAATGIVHYGPNIYKVTSLTHPDKVLVHQGSGIYATVIQGSGATVVDFPFRVSQQSQGTSFSDMNIRGDGADSTSGTNVALAINNFGVHLTRFFASHAAVGIKSHTMVGAHWNRVIAYGKDHGIKCCPPDTITDPSNENFTYESVFSVITTSASTGASGGTCFEVSATHEFANNVFHFISAESAKSGIKLLGTDSLGIGNTFTAAWIERLDASGYFVQDTIGTTIWHSPYLRMADGASLDWGNSLVHYTNITYKPKFGQDYYVGGIAQLSAGQYRLHGYTSVANTAHAQSRTLWASNSGYVAGTSTYPTGTSHAQDEQIIVSDGNVSGTVDIANIVVSPTGDTHTAHIEVEFAASSSVSGSGWGVYKRVYRWNSNNTIDEVTVNTDSNNGCTLVLTNVGGATRTVKVGCTLGAGNYRLTTRIRVFVGASGNGQLGVSIQSLI